MPYEPRRYDGGEHFPYVDLKLAPLRSAEIPEIRESDGLRELVVSLADRNNIFQSVGCDYVSRHEGTITAWVQVLFDCVDLNTRQNWADLRDCFARGVSRACDDSIADAVITFERKQACLRRHNGEIVWSCRTYVDAKEPDANGKCDAGLLTLRDFFSAVSKHEKTKDCERFVSEWRGH